MSGSLVLTMGGEKAGRGRERVGARESPVGPGQDAGWGRGRPGGFRTESRPDLNSRESPTGPAEWRQEWGRAPSLGDASEGPGDRLSAGKESGRGIWDTGFTLIPRTEPREFTDVLDGE